MATQVRLRLVQDTDTHKVSIEVAVKSNVKKYLWGDIKINADNTNLDYAVSKAAEFIATYQCEQYGDLHNPPECAKQAVEALREIQKQAERARTRPKVAVSRIDQANQ